MSTIILRYVGDAAGGHNWVPGVPACDLTDDDLMQLEASYTAEQLLAFYPPVYELVGALPKTTTAPVITIDTRDGISAGEASQAGQVLNRRKKQPRGV